MPYIKADLRKELDPLISQLAAKLKHTGQQDPANLAGGINYCITRMIFKIYGSKMRYHEHNEVMGVLECAKQEWYRRQSAEYEDVKIKENGDVFGD
jgi:hypothetical protein